MYRVARRRSGPDQPWPAYLRSVLAFGAVGVLLLYLFLRIQQHLGAPFAVPAMPPDQAWNTAVSFVTNTNWQSYSGESALGYIVQMAGLAAQNFVSAAVGIAVAVALVRGLARSKTDRLGNFGSTSPASAFGSCCHWRSFRDRVRRRRHGAELPRLRRRTHRHRWRPDDHRRTGRVARGHQGTGDERRRVLNANSRPRSRTPPRGRIGSRSSCCCPSRSRCRAPSVCRSATSGRATRSSR